MSAPSASPRRILHQRRAAQWILVGGAAIGLWAWALRPPALVQSTPASTPVATGLDADQVRPSEPEVAPLPIAGFVRTIVPAEAEAETVVAPPPPQREPEPAAAPRLQLVGIVHEHGVFRAAIYDPDQDRLVVVAEGDRVGPLTVRRIDTDEVEFDADGRSSTVRLSSAPGWERSR